MQTYMEKEKIDINLSKDFQLSKNAKIFLIFWKTCVQTRWNNAKVKLT